VGAPGYARDGGFACKTVTPAVSLVRIPDNVSFALGAAGTDAGMTSYHAVLATGQVKTGSTVGIIGFGGLGQIGSRVAVLADADVYVAEINERVSRTHWTATSKTFERASELSKASTST